MRNVFLWTLAIVMFLGPLKVSAEAGDILSLSTFKKPFAYVFQKTENFRTGALEKIRARQERTKSKIESAIEEEPATDMEEVLGENSPWLEVKNAFKYLEIFLLALLVLVFSIKFLFYAVIIILILTILRFFWFRIY